MRDLSTLQVNTSGAWKTIASFAPHRRDELVQALASLASILGDAKWSLLHVSGKREWLRAEDFAEGSWRPVTVLEPAVLQDVMVSVYAPGDDAPVVFMAYRQRDGQWYLSGTCDQVIRGAYAYAPIMDAAPFPAAKQVAAAHPALSLNISGV